MPLAAAGVRLWCFDPRQPTSASALPAKAGLSERAGTQRIVISPTTPEADFRMEMGVGSVTVQTLCSPL